MEIFSRLGQFQDKLKSVMKIFFFFFFFWKASRVAMPSRTYYVRGHHPATGNIIYSNTQSMFTWKYITHNQSQDRFGKVTDLCLHHHSKSFEI